MHAVEDRISDVTGEAAVRNYLLSLTGAPREPTELAKLKDSLEHEPDAIKRLEISSEIARLEASYRSGRFIRDPFVRHAKAYAERHHVVPEAFEAMGVPRRVLVDANLVQRPEKTRASVQDVCARISGWQPGAKFTVQDVMHISEASHNTVKRSLAILVREGKVARSGQASRSGVGRASVLYEVIN